METDNNGRLYIDDIEPETLKDIGLLCAHFGFKVHDQRFLSAKPKSEAKKDFSRDHGKEQLMRLTALQALQDIYAKGHKSVFDLMHDYYVSANMYDDKGIYGAPSAQQIIGDITGHFARLTREIVDKAPLQAFYTHHTFQRYVCAACFDFFDNEYAKRKDLEQCDNFPDIKDIILETQDPYAIANFTLYSESDFFRDHDYFMKFCRKKVKGLPKGKTITTYSQETNGISHGEVRVPKTIEARRIIQALKKGVYPPEAFFPELFSTDSVREVYEANPIERAYLLSKYPQMFPADERERLKQMMSQKAGRLSEEYLDMLLNHGNYSLHFQTRLL